MNYNEALNFILNKQSLGIMPGLDRIYRLLEIMGNPQDKIKIIHIAGTNGKGTVANSIANALADAGLKVGLFTSPWITDYTEQIQVNNECIDKNVFAEYVDKYKDNDCTEFEFLTAIMYKYFADISVDYAVVECGMGGLGDATNVEKNNISVITSISLDHTDFLGDTIQKIALEKSGIIKNDSVCILYPNPECENIFEEVCNSQNAKLIKIKNSDDYKLNNYNTVCETLNAVGVVCSDVRLANLTARQQRIKNILVDGGHNENAAIALKSIINDEIALIAMMKDKNVDAYLSHIAPKCKKIIVTTTTNSRSMSADDLKNIANKYCADVCAINNPLDALAYAKNKGLTLICGSFYLVRDIINYIWQILVCVINFKQRGNNYGYND